MFSKARLFFYFNIIFILFIILSYWRAPEELLKHKDSLSAQHGETLELLVWVCEEARLDHKLRRLTVCLEDSSRILISNALYPEYNYGDFLIVKGKLNPPPDLSDFDYSAYLAKQNIYSLMSFPQIKLSQGRLTGKQNLYRQILQLKWFLKAKIDKFLPDPESNLGSAIILGYKNLLHPDDKEDFSRAGLSHLIAISGAHIAIITALLLSFFQNLGLKRRLAIRVVLSFLVVYPILTGLSASAVRASIMGILMLLAWRFERLNLSFNALLLAASLMLAFNPLLMHDLGFQLSFSSVLGIIYFQKITQHLQKRLKSRELGFLGPILIHFSEALFLTLVCQLSILPLMIINFKQLSLVSVLANPLLLWLFPYLLASLILALVMSIFIPSLGLIFFSPAYFCLNLLIRGARYFSSLSWAVKEVPKYDNFNLIIYYLSLIVIVYFIKKRIRPIKKVPVKFN